jgi:hypothetical protein
MLNSHKALTLGPTCSRTTGLSFPPQENGDISFVPLRSDKENEIIPAPGTCSINTGCGIVPDNIVIFLVPRMRSVNLSCALFYL